MNSRADIGSFTLELRFTRRGDWTSIGVCAVIWRSDMWATGRLTDRTKDWTRCYPLWVCNMISMKSGLLKSTCPKRPLPRGLFGGSMPVSACAHWSRTGCARSMPRPRPMLNTEQAISNAMRWPICNWTVCIAMHEDGRRAWGPIFSTPLTCEHCKTEKCPKVLRLHVAIVGRL